MEIFSASGTFEPTPTFALLFSLLVVAFLVYGHHLPHLDLTKGEDGAPRRTSAAVDN